MKMHIRWMLAVALALMAGVPVLYASGLMEGDARRLEAAKARHAQQLAAASESFYNTVDRANNVLERHYEQVIRRCEQRGETEVVEALQAELATLVEASSTPIPPEPELEPGHLSMINSIGQAVVNADERPIRSTALASKEYVLLYFSASWCGPCRAFTPSLVDFYNEHGADGNFEVLLVSSDRSERDMYAYMTSAEMPFLAVPFDRIDASGLKDKYGGRGIPNLVIVDRAGEVVSGSYVDGKYVGPRKVLNDMRGLLN